MRETCAVDLGVELPKTVAQPLPERREDAEVLHRMLSYAAVRRRIFERMMAGSLVHAGALPRNA